jgi:hypothetical protein
MADSDNHVRWFWAVIVIGTVRKSERGQGKAEWELWKNLHIIAANSPEEAVAKVEEIGCSEEGDCDGTLTLHGEPAESTFLGIEDVGVCYEGVGDGAEILWTLDRMREENLAGIVQPKEKLIDILREDLGRVS